MEGLKASIALLMTLVLVLYFIFQPIFDQIYHRKQLLVENALATYIQEAAVEGRFTAEIIEEMINNLAYNLRYSPEEIKFSGTTTLTLRGNYIEGYLSVPSKQIKVLNLFNGPVEREITAYKSLMSEYIPVR